MTTTVAASQAAPLALPFPTAHAAGPDAAHHHLLIACAAMPENGCQQHLRQLALPRLDGLLALLTPAAVETVSEHDPIPPHERAAARILGTTPDAPAWAALTQAHDAPHDAPAITPTAHPSAWFTPCHWAVGADQVRMTDPATLGLDAAEAEALHAILAPWFAQDGLSLVVHTPTRWRITGAALEGVRCASLDRVLLRDVRPWLPPPTTARTLHRLHSEVQMLLYTHPFNDARTARGLPAINAFWLHGNGLPPESIPPTSAPASQPTHAPPAAIRPVVLHAIDTLRQTALRQQWSAWQQAWLDADAGPLAAWAARIPAIVHAGGSATLTLCGERAARSFTTGSRSLLQRLRTAVRPLRFADLRHSL